MRVARSASRSTRSRGGRVEDAAPACARAVEGLCAALAELAWSACDRAVYGEDAK